MLPLRLFYSVYEREGLKRKAVDEPLPYHYKTKKARLQLDAKKALLLERKAPPGKHNHTSSPAARPRVGNLGNPVHKVNRQNGLAMRLDRGGKKLSRQTSPHSQKTKMALDLLRKRGGLQAAASRPVSSKMLKMSAAIKSHDTKSVQGKEDKKKHKPVVKTTQEKRATLATKDDADPKKRSSVETLKTKKTWDKTSTPTNTKHNHVKAINTPRERKGSRDATAVSDKMAATNKCDKVPKEFSVTVNGRICAKHLTNGNNTSYNNAPHCTQPYRTNQESKAVEKVNVGSGTCEGDDTMVNGYEKASTVSVTDSKADSWTACNVTRSTTSSTTSVNNCNSSSTSSSPSDSKSPTLPTSFYSKKSLTPPSKPVLSQLNGDLAHSKVKLWKDDVKIAFEDQTKAGDHGKVKTEDVDVKDYMKGLDVKDPALFTAAVCLVRDKVWQLKQEAGSRPQSPRPRSSSSDSSRSLSPASGKGRASRSNSPVSNKTGSRGSSPKTTSKLHNSSRGGSSKLSATSTTCNRSNSSQINLTPKASLGLNGLPLPIGYGSARFTDRSHSVDTKYSTLNRDGSGQAARVVDRTGVDPMLPLCPTDCISVDVLSSASETSSDVTSPGAEDRAHSTGEELEGKSERDHAHQYACQMAFATQPLVALRQLALGPGRHTAHVRAGSKVHVSSGTQSPSPTARGDNTPGKKR
jgi:hypothetical protein